MLLQRNGLVEHPPPNSLPVGMRTVSEALDRACKHAPDQIALLDGDTAFSYLELRAAVRDVAAKLGANQAVVISGSNSAQQVITAFAALSARAPVVFNPPTSLDVDALEALTGQLDNERCIGFTSGTSGQPKVVVHSEHSLLLAAHISADLEPPTPDERIGTLLSLAILNVMVLGPISALIRQSTFVVVRPDSSPATAALVDAVNSHSITRLFAVATQLHDLITHLPDDVTLSCLDRVIVGGSGAQAETLTAFTSRFGVRPTLSYGMTEAPTGVVRESTNDPIGSRRGFPLPHVEVTIRDSAGAVVPVGQEGEICLSPSTTGPWANTWTGTAGYLGDPARTEALFAGGVMHTGDLGIVDADGAVSVTGRLTPLIIRGGMNIDPLAVASVLRNDASVADAAVCGYPDDRLGEKVGAVVVAATDAEVDFDHLRALVSQQINGHSCPDSILEWAELPYGPLGKPLALDPSVFVDETA